MDFFSKLGAPRLYKKVSMTCGSDWNGTVGGASAASTEPMESATASAASRAALKIKKNICKFIFSPQNSSQLKFLT
ncbi:MAG: hypothetical protein MJZ46_01590 [Bacteroidales bacterium]|nr:hypothetical protein [Bacteroidales bacterium]